MVSENRKGFLAVTLVGLAKRPKEALARLYHCGQEPFVLEGTAGMATQTSDALI